MMMLDKLLKWWYAVPAVDRNAVRIKAIYVFNESSHQDTYHRMISRDRAPAFLDPGGRAWEPVVWEALPKDWIAFRVEVRYEMGGKKYRRVVRPGETLAFPRREAFGGRPRLILVRLMPRDDAKPPARVVDITPRAIKYAGPTGDGLASTKLTDLFPFDDHDDNASRFECVRFIDGSFACWDVPYDVSKNPALARPM